MKIIFFSLIEEEILGVRKKIKAQVKSLEKLTRSKVIEARIEKENFYFGEKRILEYKFKKDFFNKILKKIALVKILSRLKEREYYENIDVIYIRNFKCTPMSISWLRFLKKQDLKILLEIPTYPYDREIRDNNSIAIRFLVWLDKIYRKKLYLYVDKIITFSEDKEIFNIPCINISNGIDLEEVKLTKKEKHTDINFISVSQCHFWHGIDRFLYSLFQYRKNGGKEKIKFHIVGEGIETPKLKKIVEDNLELQDIVVFHGFKSGKDLDEIYNNSDIALGSLGFNRINLEKGSTLKMREYCAKGIPFVVGYDDTSFSKDLPFYYQVSNDESLLDIEKIIEWYKNLKVTPEEIRKYAEDNLTWDKQMKKVIDNI